MSSGLPVNSIPVTLIRLVSAFVKNKELSLTVILLPIASPYKKTLSDNPSPLMITFASCIPELVGLYLIVTIAPSSACEGVIVLGPTIEYILLPPGYSLFESCISILSELDKPFAVTLSCFVSVIST